MASSDTKEKGSRPAVGYKLFGRPEMRASLAHHSAGFSSNDRQLLSGGLEYLHLWDLNSFSEIEMNAWEKSVVLSF